jgi:hypothetical protein
MLAEEVGAPTRPFSVLPEFRYLLAVKSYRKELLREIAANGASVNPTE